MDGESDYRPSQSRGVSWRDTGRAERSRPPERGVEITDVRAEAALDTAARMSVDLLVLAGDGPTAENRPIRVPDGFGLGLELSHDLAGGSELVA